MAGAVQFVVFTKVVDKKTLNIIFLSVVSFISTAIPLVFAFLPDAVASQGALGGDGCALTDVQAEALRGQLRTFNASCSYNVSVGGVPLGV